MKIGFTNNFCEWAIQDKNLVKLSIDKKKPTEKEIASIITGLKASGVKAGQMASMIGRIIRSYEAGYGEFSLIRFIIYYWENGDKIIFPLNSQNVIYLGNDDKSWCKYWKFLERNQEILYEQIKVNEKQHINQILAIGGQNHFGHFIMNRVLGLAASCKQHGTIKECKYILIPPGYEQIHKKILESFLGEKKVYIEFPKKNGIINCHNTIIPCIDPHPGTLSSMQGKISDKYGYKKPMSRKYIYLTRGENNCNDRLDGYHELIKNLKKHGFIIANPTNLSHSKRVNLLGDSDLVISDAGSCGFNAFLYTNREAEIRQFIPKRAYEMNASEEILSQLETEIIEASRGLWIGLNSKEISAENAWKDLCEAPNLQDIEKIISDHKMKRDKALFTLSISQ